METRQLQWTVGHANSPDRSPERFVPAQVPGAVQLDWARAEGWGPHYFAENWQQYLWMEDAHWIYQTRLEIPSQPGGERVFFVSRGIDYRFNIRLNGKVIFEQEGMFSGFEIELTGRASTGDLLEVVVFPAPKSRPEPADRVQADQSCKPAVSYGWDFHPRLIPLGIWDETYLEFRPEIHIQSYETRYQLNPDRTAAQICCEIQLSGAAKGKSRWTLMSREGQCVLDHNEPIDADRMTLEATLERPELWWPNGQGDAALYTSHLELFDTDGKQIDHRVSRVGFRTIELVMHHDAWEWPPHPDFPKGPSNPPITVRVNGRPIFCKGSNWVAPDIFPGTIVAQTYRPLLELARQANMNMLRLWGGAIVNKDSFYEQCDAMGILIWQEFPLACNRYEGTPHYLRVLDQESRSIVRRLRSHACIALWCGGNELFNCWSRMTMQDAPIRLLNRNCYDLDPKRPFLPTSPIMGMGHGPYLFRHPSGDEVFQRAQIRGWTALTEFGCAGPASVATLKTIIPESELFPPRRGTSYVSHHGFDSWGTDWDTWLVPKIVEDYLGAPQSLEEMVDRGQLLQSEALKGVFEEARRQKPTCAMALNWCFNEPWPTAANNSIVSWPAEPKAAYLAVAGSLRPALCSARFGKFRWEQNEQFEAELWLLNDAPCALTAGRMKVTLAMPDGVVHPLLNWDHPAVEPNVNLPGPTVRFRLPPGSGGRMILRLAAEGKPDWDSHYVLVYRNPAAPAAKAPAAAILNQ